MPVLRHEHDTTAPHLIAPLGPAQHAEDDLVQDRARPEEHPGLVGPDGHLHQSPTFGHEAHTAWHPKGDRTENDTEMSFLGMVKDGLQGRGRSHPRIGSGRRGWILPRPFSPSFTIPRTDIAVSFSVISPFRGHSVSVSCPTIGCLCRIVVVVA